MAACPLVAAAAGTNPQNPRNPVNKEPHPVSFARDVRPIIADKCLKCHGPDNTARRADLRLDTPEGCARAFQPHTPTNSSGYQRMVTRDPARQMPPPGSGKSLTAAQKETIRRWIEQGATWERHWSFIPPALPSVPAERAIVQKPQIQNRKWCVNPIDNFILDRLAKEGLKPSPEASRETLIRRVTIDLTGLPPTLAEIDAFVADRSPNAYDKVVDRLLASPRFGERWVWEWLDAARYSDTNGFQEDRYRPMWPWRDWAINALNFDMPYDQFTVEQIAGDLLPNPTQSQLIATGFNRNHMLNGEGGRIPEESRVDYVVDRVDTTSTVFLGLTMGCARCHEHKFDPFTNKEYYQLYAYFNNVPETGAVDHNGSADPVLPLPTPEQKLRIEQLTEKRRIVESRLSSLAKEAPERADAQKQADGAKKELEDLRNSVLVTMIMGERKEPRETHVLIRGSYEKPGETVGCGVPAALPSLPNGVPNNRLGFAKWLVDPSNPLTARVAVNRVWQTLFGNGIVKTSEDFGIQGEPPSHPELLDWLAVMFMETGKLGNAETNRGVEAYPNFPVSGVSYRLGWSVKKLIRLIVTSATYRQSSRVTPALLEKDPDNRLLARGPRYRWPSFVLRDQALAMSGLLVEKLGGPPVKPYQPEGVWEDFSYGKIKYDQDHGESLYRRSLYTFWRRSVAPTTLFDTAARRVCTVRSTRTNTPLQALTMLNDTTFVEASRKLAERMMKEGGPTVQGRVTLAFRMATGRKPTVRESAAMESSFQRYLAKYMADPGAVPKVLAVGESKADPALNSADLAAYTAVAAIILNLDEVISKT